MRVSTERAAKRERVGARLFLCDSPARLAFWFEFALQREVTIDERGPFDPRLSSDPSAFHVHTQDRVEAAHVEQRFIGEELLRAHSVARAAHSETSSCFTHRAHDGDEIFD